MHFYYFSNYFNKNVGIVGLFQEKVGKRSRKRRKRSRKRSRKRRARLKAWLFHTLSLKCWTESTVSEYIRSQKVHQCLSCMSHKVRWT